MQSQPKHYDEDECNKYENHNDDDNDKDDDILEDDGRSALESFDQFEGCIYGGVDCNRDAMHVLDFLLTWSLNKMNGITYYLQVNNSYCI